MCVSVCDVSAFFLLQCNNPKTKEPKLTAAARIVPEWLEYDNEIKQLLRRAQEREDAAPQKPSTSPHKKGEQQCFLCEGSAFPPHRYISALVQLCHGNFSLSLPPSREAA